MSSLKGQEARVLDHAPEEVDHGPGRGSSGDRTLDPSLQNQHFTTVQLSGSRPL